VNGGGLGTGPGLLFVVSGPSGAGKDTLVEALRERRPSLRYSVSVTTRAPRPEERNGGQYFFVSPQEFEGLRHDGRLLEWREYNGNLYGTPSDYVEQNLIAGYDVVMKPEVNGALAVKASYPAAVLIFLVPDRFSHLRERLLARRTETNEEIARRLEIAQQEMKFIRSFDYIVVNEQDHPTEAVRDLDAILQAEHFRIHRYPDDSIQRVESS
jgi:guanylate kinase